MRPLAKTSCLAVANLSVLPKLHSAGLTRTVQPRSTYFRLEPAANFVGLFSQAHENVHDPGIFVGCWIEEETIISKTNN